MDASTSFVGGQVSVDDEVGASVDSVIMNPSPRAADPDKDRDRIRRIAAEDDFIV
jgi:hypothetical protein